MKFISNAFSLQMLAQLPASVTCTKISPEEIPADAMSCIGHADTAAVVSSIIGRQLPANRINIELIPGDELYVAQLTGGRLPEGATTLPPGFKLKFLKVTIM